MKRIIYHFLVGALLLMMLTVTVISVHAQTTIAGNWTLDRTYTSSNGNSYYDDITFYDGLGYPEQVVQVGASANTGKNIVTPIYYDLVRRSDVRVYLPYVTTVSTRTEVSMSSVFSSQATWYNNNGYSGQGAYAFTQKDYDDSPLSRVTATYKPGSTHASASGDRPVEYEYAANGASEVRKLTVSTSTQNLSISGYWPAGSFIKTTVEDEDGRTVITFSDLDGRTHMTRVMNGTTAMDTYTVYDAYGNLSWVVTPEGSAVLPSSGTWSVTGDSDVNTSNAAKYCYIYKYDGLGRCQTRKFPGKALEELVFDNAGRLTMSRDGEQRSDGKWITYKYDVHGNLLERRLLSSTQGRSYYQNLFFNLTPSAAYPSTATLLEENVYGSYSSATGLGFSAVSGVTVMPDTGRITSLLTYSRTAVMDGSTVSGYVSRAYYYDALGRLIQTVESDPDGTVSRYSTAYSFTGDVTAETEMHGPDTKTSQYTYDARGRLLSETTSVNGSTAGAIAYAYDNLGNLTDTYYGPASSSSTRVKQTDTRNILGWLTGRTAKIGSSTNVFTMSLDYWSPTPSSVATGLYGGDVTAWHWTQGTNTQRTYVLSYDGAGRLTDSRTVSGNGTTASASWSERNMTYDRNGNLKTLSRYGSSSSSPTQSLSYTYTGNRRSGYSYDSDGRVTTDDAGGVTRTYGILGNPYQTKTGNTVNAQYTYLSDGTRTKAVDSSGSGYAYRGSFVYNVSVNGETLESVAFGGGRIEKNGTGYEVAYHITDHLGSVRSIVKNGTIVEQNDYYPFGGRLADSALSQQSSPFANRWRFSGKEDFSVALGDPVLDFGARMYSTTGAMWQTQDPMAEKYYGIAQYAYCASSPTLYIDPFGLTKYYINDEEREIDDGDDSMSMNVSEKEFAKLTRKFDRSSFSYARYRNHLSYKHGFTTRELDYSTSNGDNNLATAVFTSHSPGNSYLDYQVSSGYWGTLLGISSSAMSSLSSEDVLERINVGDNGKFYYLQFSGRIFHGNQYVKVEQFIRRYASQISAMKTFGSVLYTVSAAKSVFSLVSYGGNDVNMGLLIATEFSGYTGGLLGVKIGGRVGSLIGSSLSPAGAVSVGIVGGISGSLFMDSFARRIVSGSY